MLALALGLSLAGGAALAEPEARKGTRNYRADGAAAAVTETPSAAVTKDDKLQQCMETWDKGTHITKPKWREICIRQLDAR